MAFYHLISACEDPAISPVRSGNKNVNEVEKGGLTPLHEACYNSDLGEVRYLTSFRIPNLPYSSLKLFSPFFDGSQKVADFVEKVMLARHRTAMHPQLLGSLSTPLHMAAKAFVRGENKDSEAVLEHMLERVRWPNIQDAYGNTPLHLVIHKIVSSKKFDLLRLFARAGEGADFNIQNNKKSTPMHIAISKEIDEDAIALLLELGANLNARGRDGGNCLHYAVENNASADVVKFFLEKGADFTIRDAYGRTPLRLALDKGRRDIISAMVNTRKLTNNDSLLLMRVAAIETGYRDMLADILDVPYFEEGKRIDDRSLSVYRAMTPLMEACLVGANKSVEMLIQKGAAICTDEFVGGRTLIEPAGDSGVAAFRAKGNILISNGLDESSARQLRYFSNQIERNQYSVLVKAHLTPLNIAVKTENLALIEKLLDFGAAKKLKLYQRRKLIRDAKHLTGDQKDEIKNILCSSGALEWDSASIKQHREANIEIAKRSYKTDKKLSVFQKRLSNNLAGFMEDLKSSITESTQRKKGWLLGFCTKQKQRKEEEIEKKAEGVEQLTDYTAEFLHGLLLILEHQEGFNDAKKIAGGTAGALIGISIALNLALLAYEHYIEHHEKKLLNNAIDFLRPDDMRILDNEIPEFADKMATHVVMICSEVVAKHISNDKVSLKHAAEYMKDKIAVGILTGAIKQDNLFDSLETMVLRSDFAYTGPSINTVDNQTLSAKDVLDPTGFHCVVSGNKYIASSSAEGHAKTALHRVSSVPEKAIANVYFCEKSKNLPNFLLPFQVNQRQDILFTASSARMSKVPGAIGL